MARLMLFFQIKIYYKTTNRASEQIIQQVFDLLFFFSILLHADGSYILYQHKEVDEIEKQIKAENICNWFVDSKLSIHFGKDKAKSILFASKQRLQNVRQLDLNL